MPVSQLEMRRVLNSRSRDTNSDLLPDLFKPYLPSSFLMLSRAMPSISSRSKLGMLT